MSDGSDGSEGIGAILKEARRRRGLRVKDVAARTTARISPSYLSCIENDLRLPSEELLLELARLLGLDQREVYRKLVRAKAPAAIRDDFLHAAAPADETYQALKGLTLTELVERATEATQARRELQALGQRVAELETELKACGPVDYVARWQAEASRYRMLIERTVMEAVISEAGDVTVRRHVIGLTPQPGKRPILLIQHTTTRLTELPGTAEDDELKFLEQPADMAVEVEREARGSKQTVIRLVFPDGYGYEKGKDRRLSYSFRSSVAGAYTMERSLDQLVPDTLRSERGTRATFVIGIDKPTEDLEFTVCFPRYYIPDDVVAWASTQDFYEADDNLIDQGICEEWKLRSHDDYRVSLQIRRPQVGVRYGIAWMPLYRDEFAETRRRLEGEFEP